MKNPHIICVHKTQMCQKQISGLLIFMGDHYNNKKAKENDERQRRQENYYNLNGHRKAPQHIPYDII